MTPELDLTPVIIAVMAAALSPAMWSADAVRDRAVYGIRSRNRSPSTPCPAMRLNVTVDRPIPSPTNRMTSLRPAGPYVDPSPPGSRRAPGGLHRPRAVRRPPPAAPSTPGDGAATFGDGAGNDPAASRAGSAAAVSPNAAAIQWNTCVVRTVPRTFSAVLPMA